MAIPLALGLAACDFPTEIPKWDTVWVVPGESTTIAVSTLLPSSISTSGSSFALSLPAATVTQTLEQLCAACAPLQGQTVPKPAFDLSSSSAIPLPGRVNSATFAGGTLAVSLTHDFSFDPLRPDATAFGYILLTATSGGVTVARDSIDGQSVAFPSGSTLTRAVPIATGTVGGSVTVTVRVVSPAGGSVTVDTTDRLLVTATPAQVQVSQATIAVTNQTVSGAQAQLDLDDVETSISERVKAGALLLTVVNPFAGTTGTLNLSIAAPDTVIRKSVPLGAGTTRPRVELSGPEIRAILGTGPVTLSVAGTVSGPGGGVTVTPSQVVAITSRIELTLGPKED